MIPNKIFTALNRFQPWFSSHIALYHATYQSVPGDLKKGLHNVSPTAFESQVKWLKKNYKIVSIDEYFSCDTKRGLACITFDDAYESVFSNALPILIQMNVPSTIFINGCTLEEKPFWRDKIRYIINNNLIEKFFNFLHRNNKTDWGFSPDNFYFKSKSPSVNSKAIDYYIDAFLLQSSHEKPAKDILYCAHVKQQLIDHPLVTYGNHTYNHYVLSSLSETEQEDEISKNDQLLNDMNLRLSHVFSIPFGGINDVNLMTYKILKNLNYSAVLFNQHRLNFRMHARTNQPISEAYRYMQPKSYEAFQSKIFRMAYIDPWLRLLFKR